MGPLQTAKSLTAGHYCMLPSHSQQVPRPHPAPIISPSPCHLLFPHLLPSHQSRPPPPPATEWLPALLVHATHLLFSHTPPTFPYLSGLYCPHAACPLCLLLINVRHLPPSVWHTSSSECDPFYFPFTMAAFLNTSCGQLLLPIVGTSGAVAGVVGNIARLVGYVSDINLFSLCIYFYYHHGRCVTTAVPPPTIP